MPPSIENSHIHKTFRYLLKVNNLSITEIAKEVGRSHLHTTNCLINWRMFTGSQLTILAGLFNMPLIELMYLLTKKQKQLTNEDKQCLRDIAEKYKDIE